MQKVTILEDGSGKKQQGWGVILACNTKKSTDVFSKEWIFQAHLGLHDDSRIISVLL